MGIGKFFAGEWTPTGGYQDRPRPTLTLVKNDDKKADVWEPIWPVPDEAPACPIPHPAPQMRFTYKTGDGHLIGYIDRIVCEKGKKLLLPHFWGKMNGKLGWYRKHLSKPRPLYGLDRLAANPKAPVPVVEGEKCADAGARLLGDSYVVICWLAGSANVKSADWRPIAGRQVGIWPDNDAAGFKAASQVKGIVDRLPKTPASRVLEVPEKLDRGYDIADAEEEGWTPQQVAAFIETGCIPHKSIKRKKDDDFDPQNPFFLTVGMDLGTFLYRQVRNGEVSYYSADEHDDSFLSKLAPLAYWRTGFRRETLELTGSLLPV